MVTNVLLDFIVLLDPYHLLLVLLVPIIILKGLQIPMIATLVLLEHITILKDNQVVLNVVQLQILQ